MTESKVRAAAEEYAGVKFEGIGPFGEAIYSADNLFLLEQREVKTNAFQAGVRWMEEQVREYRCPHCGKEVTKWEHVNACGQMGKETWRG